MARAGHRAATMEIVARCRRIGWDVEEAQGSQGLHWWYRITPPGDNAPVYIHKTPSDVNAYKWVWSDLKAAGFDEAEAAWLKADAERKAAKLAAAKEKADARAAKMAAQSAAVIQAAGKYASPQEVDIAWLTTPSEWPETRTAIVTPEAAKLVLDTMNTHNRRMSPARVAYFEDVIEHGEFGTTHQGIAIDSAGVLQDGQTRLQAVVNCSKAVVMQVSVGMDPRNFMRVDTGRTRSASDTAYVMGEADPATISATARMLVIIEREGTNAYIRRSGHMPPERVGLAIESYGDALRRAVRDGRRIKRELGKANPSALAAAIFLIRQRLPEGDTRVERFFDDLAWGVDLGRSDPVLLLRRNLNSQRVPYYDRWEVCALVIKAWNLRANGEMRQSLVWKRNEPFPASVFLPPRDDEHLA